MAIFADISTYTSAGEFLGNQILSFPVIIGRDVNCHLVVGDAESGVSRQHAVLEVVGETVTLRDSSSNGTDYGGRLLRNGERIRVLSRDTFSIRGIRFEVGIKEIETASAANMIARIVDNQYRELERVGLDGCRLVGSLRESQLEFSVVPNSISATMKPEHVFHILDLGTAIQLELGPSAAAAEVLVNNYATKQQIRSIHQLDAVQAGDFRIEIISRDDPILRCPNQSCRLLNLHQVNANCRWCGTRLSEAATVYLKT